MKYPNYLSLFSESAVAKLKINCLNYSIETNEKLTDRRNLDYFSGNMGKSWNKLLPTLKLFVHLHLSFKLFMSMKKALLAALLCAGCLCAGAQETEKVKPFRNLSIGVEAGTTGVGVEIATNLHRNFSLRAGFVTFPLSINTTFDIATEGVNGQTLDALVNQYPEVKTALEAKGLPTSSGQLDTDVDLTAKLGLASGKVLVDYYPWSRKTFHITAGAYFGESKLVKVDGYLPQKTIDVMNTANAYLPAGSKISTTVNIGDQEIDVNDLNGHVDAWVKRNGFRSYLGIGFGRAVPKNRIGVQFDLGAMFHGTPKIESSNGQVSDALNKEAESDNFVKTMKKVVVYPVLSLKLVGRIF